MGPLGLSLLELSVSGEGIRAVAELTLALVLFSDAATADLGVLRRTFHLPQRLLLVGLPATIALGAGAAVLLFPGLGLVEAAILSTMLAPTDAALGKAVVTHPAVPSAVREGLNVESGLNDGICVPILLAFLGLASEADGGARFQFLALRLLLEQVGIGLGVGVVLTVAAAGCLRAAARRSWVVEPWLGVPIVALTFACFATSQLAGGSGFIACFSGGLVFGALTREHKHALLAGAEGTGQAFSLVTWVVFGAAIVGQHHGALGWRVVVYALLSVTVVRMLPVLLSTIGLGLRIDARLFLGWFGPRGLASVVFGVIVANARLPGEETLIATTVATVLLSIVAHGLSANPLAGVLGRRSNAEGQEGARG